MAGKRRQRIGNNNKYLEKLEDMDNPCWNGKRIKHKFNILTWNCGFFCYMCECGIYGKPVFKH